MSLWSLRQRKSHQSAKRKASSQDEKVKPQNKNNHRRANAVHYFVSVKITPWLLHSTNTGRTSNWIPLLQIPSPSQLKLTAMSDSFQMNPFIHSSKVIWKMNCGINQYHLSLGVASKISFPSLVSSSIWAAHWLHVETAASLQSTICY